MNEDFLQIVTETIYKLFLEKTKNKREDRYFRHKMYDSIRERISLKYKAKKT